MRARRFFRLRLVSCTLAMFALGVSQAWQAPPVFHATTPIGYDVLLIKPEGPLLTILGLIECPDLEGAQQVAEGVNARIVNADGQRLAYFPANFSFRITASLRKTVIIEPNDVFNIYEKPQDLLVHLKFRLKVYHGLEVRKIQPESVQMIGVPADIPYDERVYRISFNVDNLPVTDRCVLEVLSPSGERLTKFHFDLL